MGKINGSVLVWLLCAAPVLAEQTKDTPAPAVDAETQAMMAAWVKASTPGTQHARLAEHFAGSWNVTQTVWWDPETPPSVQTGKATTQALYGGRTLHMAFEGSFMGRPFEGVGYTGYDNVTGRYYSGWTDSMGTGFSMAHGDYDEATRTYTFRTEMADPMKPGSMTPLRNVIRIVDADHHVFEMYESHDGNENKSMVIEYKRAR